MHPILFQWGPLTLRTYGALIALAFVASLRLAKWAVRGRDITEKFLMDLALILIFSGLVGARLFYVMLNIVFYIDHPLDIFKVWEGGLVFYGGFIAAIIAGTWFAKRHRVRVGLIADCLAPALALGQAIGRWGCFFAGCCYGKPSELPWAVKFRDPGSLAPLDIALHPVQVYEALGCLGIAFILWTRLAKRPTVPRGQVFWLYVLLYGMLRFALELFRGDDRGPLMAHLFPSQIIALLAILVSASILITQIASPTEDADGTHVEN